MSSEHEQQNILHELMRLIDPIRKNIPLDTEIIYKRKMYSFEEWKVEYTVEGPATMPEPAGHKVPAYILIPNDRSKAPFPAMLCFHQCFLDCDIGKEAVVGKIIDRVDQAYGYELVQEGFVVIAPDSIGCGERNLSTIRKEGERMEDGAACGLQINKCLGKPWVQKTILDNMKTVDVLESLDIVDPNRIGVIGHSMGSHISFITMAADQRIKAGILSGFTGIAHGLFKDYEEGLSYLAPRLLMELKGLYDGSPQEIQIIKNAHKYAQKQYDKLSSSENLLLRTPPCGHYFHDEFKWEAYAKLKRYFHMEKKKELIPLEKVLKKARENVCSFWNEDEKVFPIINSEHMHYIMGNNDELEDAFEAIFIPLCQKIPFRSSLRIDIEEDENSIYITCIIPNGDDNAKIAHEYAIRKANKVFTENFGVFERKQLDNELKWIVKLSKGYELC